MPDDTTPPASAKDHRASPAANDDERHPLLEYLDELDAMYGPPSPELVAEMEAVWESAEHGSEGTR